MDKTPFVTKCEILSAVWMEYRDDADLEDFMEFHDLGLPLAYSIDANLAELNEKTEKIVNETFYYLLEALELEEVDRKWNSLEEMFAYQRAREEAQRVEGLDEEQITIESAYSQGAEEERERIREIFSMYMRWAEDKNRASEYMFWKKARDIIEPIDIDFSREAYDEQNRKDGF